ncbi:uncharacterized protein LOC123037266 [Drosophila rhopaloa]|uniref:CCHC-type domain-containing protein n=1 Tax=Drosophila rhopaloa TaxID=1041015 RepID=A0ABM5J2T3_DRORH|nr:uncharacterized protein LOC123037266 [Drosophila rhopaloa]
MTVHELVQYLIDGIQNVQLKNQAKLLRFAVPADVLEAFQDVEKPKAPVQQGRMQGTSLPNAVTPEQRVIKCFNCHSFGHQAKECRKPVEKLDTWLESVHCTRRKRITTNIVPHRFGKSRFVSKEIRSSQ